jgi:hypothetical protein
MKRAKLKKKFSSPEAEARSVAIRFKPGNSGRPVGCRPLLNRSLKEIILEAGARLGSNGRGKDGLIGFIMSVGRKHPTHLLALIGKVLPVELEAPVDENKRYRSVEEVMAEMKSRGLPVERIFAPPPGCGGEPALPPSSNGRVN